jgi:hypothetical protein
VPKKLKIVWDHQADLSKDKTLPNGYLSKIKYLSKAISMFL